MKTDLEKYQDVLSDIKDLIKAEKARIKANERFCEMRMDTHTATRRAGASDRLTDACFSRDCSKDRIHKSLVDAGLAKPNSKESYETREISQSAGFGHSIRFNYTPPLPECYK